MPVKRTFCIECGLIGICEVGVQIAVLYYPMIKYAMLGLRCSFLLKRPKKVRSLGGEGSNMSASSEKKASQMPHAHQHFRKHQKRIGQWWGGVAYTYIHIYIYIYMYTYRVI